MDTIIQVDENLLVINDPDEVHRIAGMTIDWMKAVKEANRGDLALAGPGVKVTAHK